MKLQSSALGQVTTGAPLMIQGALVIINKTSNRKSGSRLSEKKRCDRKTCSIGSGQKASPMPAGWSCYGLADHTLKAVEAAHVPVRAFFGWTKFARTAAQSDWPF